MTQAQPEAGHVALAVQAQHGRSRTQGGLHAAVTGIRRDD